MKQIVLDTNFIMYCLAFKIGIKSELARICDFNYTLCILSASLRELEKLIKEGEYFERKRADLAMQFIRKSALKVLPLDGYADELLEGLDKAQNIIATQDFRLRKKLKAKGFKTIVIRQKSHFEFQ